MLKITGPRIPRSTPVSLMRVGAVTCAGLVAFATVAIVALVLSAERFSTASERASHAAAVSQALNRTGTALDDMQSALHSYVAFNDEDDLPAWERNRKRLFLSIDALLGDLPSGAEHRLVQQLAGQATSYVNDYGTPLIELRRHANPGVEESERRIDLGRDRIDAFRSVLERLGDFSRTSDGAAVAHAKSAAGTDRLVGISALAGGIMLLIAAAIAVRRGILVPLRRLQAVAERLSAGDLSARLRGRAPREFAPLTGAFNQMAAELSQRGRQLTDDLEAARLEVLHRLARATEFRDDDTHEHTERVGKMAAAVGQALGLDETFVATLRLAAPLHDVGKIGVPDAILLKPGRLTPAEYAEMQRHTTFGAEMLAGSPSPVLQLAERIALGHHERWDGDGYPMGLVGAQTPLAARIVAVADVYDALTHTRPYKEAWPEWRARDEIRSQAGRQFDPDVVAAFLTLPLVGDVSRAPLAEEALELAGDHVT